PSNSGGDTSINDHADATYAAYATPSASGTVSVNSAIDQQTYQPDPVSQGLLNLLGTPDVSFCMDSSETHWNSDCKLLVSQLVKSNIIGTLPKPNEFFSYGYNQKFLSQLNASTLLGPLLYSTDPGAPPSGNTQPGQTSGLTAQNQAQEAFNYIRYATNSVAPQSTPSQKNYSKTYFTAFPPKGTTAPSLTVQMQAQGSLSTYFSKLRVFAAQTSVVYGNLYYLFAKRMPQKREGGNSQTSDALNEMTMATWRLFTPSGASKKDWLNQINQASSATVGKEAAVLLAEINYQLYLMRQQQERILLTNSLILSTVTLQGYPNLQQQK
ncbi:MAG: type IV secretion protein IcmX, partial [Legionellales bacterium]|nr:type IV secretion protein IcmX [Legionellales bacterium]